MPRKSTIELMISFFLCNFRYMNVDPDIAEKKTNGITRLVNWRTRKNKIHYEFLVQGMFSDNDNPVI